MKCQIYEVSNIDNFEIKKNNKKVIKKVKIMKQFS